VEIHSLLSMHGLSGLRINQAGDAVSSVYLLAGKLTSDQQAVSIQAECCLKICQTRGSLPFSSRLSASRLCEGLSNSLCGLRQRCAESAVTIGLLKERCKERGRDRTLLCTLTLNQAGLIYALGPMVAAPQLPESEKTVFFAP